MKLEMITKNIKVKCAFKLHQYLDREKYGH